MRNGQACPISGGNEMCGNSGDRVSVRSTTLIFPPASSFASCASAVMLAPCQGGRKRKAQRGVGCHKSKTPRPKPTSCGKLLLQGLWIVAPSGQPFLRHIARIEILDAFAQGLDHRAGERSGRDLRRRQELVPLGGE